MHLTGETIRFIQTVLEIQEADIKKHLDEVYDESATKSVFYKDKPEDLEKRRMYAQRRYHALILVLDEIGFEQGNARRRFFEVVLLFEDIIEKDTFMGYVHLHKDIFLDKLKSLEGGYSWIEASNNLERKQIVTRLHTGKVLNQMLFEFRDCNR